MLIFYHDGVKVVEMADANDFSLEKYRKKTIAEFLFDVAEHFPNELVIWCHHSLKEYLNSSEIESLFHHKKLLLSYNPSKDTFLGKYIGYVDASPFININKDVSFATWEMSSWVGGVSAEVLNALQYKIPFDKNFDYFLCSLGKQMMPKGLFCYSEPKLLNTKTTSIAVKSSIYVLFRFVKQHYKSRWLFLMLLNLFLYERKFPIFAFLFSFIYKRRSATNTKLDSIKVQSSRKVVEKGTVDVIIPTIGRKSYLYDILKDLSKQTKIPNKIIIVEQNPEVGSSSELDYITNENWPFEIEHIFTHQAGACNARNLALKEIRSEWVFLADDDIRIDGNFIEKVLENIKPFGTKAVTLKCFQRTEKHSFLNVFQWVTFGSGCSFVLAKSLKTCKFNMGYEFGFGEDGDFGMQLRNKGCDVLFLPEPSILHLKAPIGGFRTKPILQWQNDPIQPKPSPTVRLYQITHDTIEQQLGYKTILFFKYYKVQAIKNPFRYFFNFQKQWNSSVYWASKLKKQNEA